MSRRLTKYEFEKLVWDARISPTTKLIALAITTHMGRHKTEADPSIERLAYMCQVDQRTIRRHLKDIETALGVEVEARAGKRNLFKLQVFNTAKELEEMLSSDPWKGAQWHVFVAERNPKRPDHPSDLERLLADLENLTQEVKNVGDLNGHSGLNGASPLTLVSPLTLMSTTPDTSVTPPLTLVSPKPNTKPNKNLKDSAGAPKQVRTKGAVSAKPDATFDAFWGDYRKAMREAGGKAEKNSRSMSKPDASKAWQVLDLFQRDSARRFIRAYAADAGEYMCAADKYLSRTIFLNHAEDAADDERGHREKEVEILARFLAGKMPWTQGMTDKFVGKPGTADCNAAPDIQAEAATRAAQMMEPTDA